MNKLSAYSYGFNDETTDLNELQDNINCIQQMLDLHSGDTPVSEAKGEFVQFARHLNYVIEQMRSSLREHHHRKQYVLP